jgi:hypothetical protein
MEGSNYVTSELWLKHSFTRCACFHVHFYIISQFLGSIAAAGSRPPRRNCPPRCGYDPSLQRFETLAESGS